MRFRYIFFIFITALFCAPDLRAEEGEALKQTAHSVLGKAFKNYHLKSFRLRVRQEVFLANIKETIKSSGFLNKRENKFRMRLEGQPSSLFLFDGNFLWYQADLSEKVVFRFKNHPQIRLLSGFFSKEIFFDTFEIKRMKRQNKIYILQLHPKTKIEGLKEIFIKVGSHISEARIIWETLNNWQKLSFSKPLPKTFPDSFFQFSSRGFQVIQQD